MSKLRIFWEQDKSNTALLMELLEHYRQAGDFNALITLFDEIPPTAVSDNIRLQKAETYIHLGQSEKVESVLALIQDSATYHHEINYLKALVAFFAGDLDKVSLILVTDLAQSLISAKVLYMRALYLQGKLQEALHVQSVIMPEEITAEGLGLISLMNLDAGNNDVARQQAQGVLQAEPYNVDALVVEASMQVFEQNLTNADELLDRCIQVMPHVGRAWSLKGQVAFLGFNFDGAFDYLSQALVYMDNHIGTWHLYAWTCLLKDNIEDAKKAFNVALNLNDKFGDTYGGLAVIAFVEGDLSNAEKLSKKGIRLDKTSASSQYAKVLLEEKSGQEDKALERVQHLLSRNSHLTEQTYIDLISRVIGKQE